MTPYTYQDNLETERLLTRKLTKGDTAIWADFFNDKEAIEFFPFLSSDSNEEKSRNWIDRQLNRYAENRFGLQALIDKRTNLFVGQCGLLAQEVDGKAETEVGYHIFKKYWGQGFAPEAARLFIDYAFKNNLTNSIISIIDRKNIRSQSVAEKNRLTKEKETTWSTMNVYIYRIDKKNWAI
jgi:[ribosomal protein S5]-alanine N-acetyltransferase